MTEEIHALRSVRLREAWPNEALDFTPWLAGNLDRLGDALGMDLEFVKREASVPNAGRADIIARQARTDAKVVIENQLGRSDDSHCLRLLGYAAGEEAYVLVWVARDFTEYHRRILNWVNEADTIDVYAVTVRAYRVGDALAADFRTVVEPTQPQPGKSSSVKKTWSTRYAEFYRPLVARLRRSGIHPVGRGGWRGRWRSFQTGHAAAIYTTALHEGRAHASLVLTGPDHQRTYGALIHHRADIDAKLDQRAKWREGDRDSGLGLATEQLEPLQQWGPEDGLEAVREELEKLLVQLRDTVQPYLDQVMEAAHDDGEGAGERTE